MKRSEKRIADVALVVLALIGAATGAWSYWLTPPAGSACSTEDPTWHCYADAVYEGLKLLALSGEGSTTTPWSVLARGLGVLFAFGVVVRLLAPKALRLLLQLHVSLYRDHWVIVGLGTKGRALVLGRQGHRVVGIEQDQELAGELEWGRLGCYVLHGDARKPGLLEAANVKRASVFVAATGSDVQNIEIGLRACSLVDELPPKARRRHSLPIRLFAHVVGPALRREAFRTAHSRGAGYLRPFCLPDTAARLLLARFAPALRARESGAVGANLVFIGFDAYAEALLLSVLRLGPLRGQAPPRVTVFAQGADALRCRLLHDFPALTDMARGLEFRESLAQGSPSLEDLRVAEPDDEPVTAIFVHAESDAAALKIALSARSLSARRGRWRAPLFLRLDDSKVLGTVLKRIDETPFAEEVCDAYGDQANSLAAAIGREWHEELAKQIHARYLKRKRKVADRSPAERAWNELSEELRESNRRVVDHYVLKLASTGHIIGGPAGDVPVLRSKMPDELAKGLAEYEHEAWMREKLLEGWQYGRLRDERRKRHPHLTSFAQLTRGVQREDFEQLSGVESELLSPWGPLQDLVEQARARHGTTVFCERVIGLVGHSVIRKRDADHINEELPKLLGRLRGNREHCADANEEFWTLVTPLAPGSDLVLAKAALDWLGASLEDSPCPEVFPRFRLIVAQALPLAALVHAWQRQKGWQAGTLDGANSVPADPGKAAAKAVRVLERFIRSCGRPETPRARTAGLSRYVDLAPPELTLDTACTATYLGEALRRNDAYLLDHAHDLVVVLDPGRYGFQEFDAENWLAQPEDKFGEGGTGAIVWSWLQRRDGDASRLHLLLLPQ